MGSKIFFNLFVFFIAIAYMSTILSKFPGNFTDFYPIHTWDEIRTHGYLLEKFGCAVACGCSASESKMIVMRNWIGKITSRPIFDDATFPTFRRWVDAFCDEGHREGARILWMAWADFLDTDPPMAFLEQWSLNLRTLSWDQAAQRSPFDLKWDDGKGRKVLPVMPEQAEKFLTLPGQEVPGGGVELQPDSLAKLKDLFEVFKLLPNNLVMEPSLPKAVDCILTRKVGLSCSTGDDEEDEQRSFTLSYSKGWRNDLDKRIKTRTQELSLSKESYTKSLRVTDKNGAQVSLVDSELSALTERHFPLHFREPVARRDRQAILVYIARGRPESERPGVDMTRCLDKYLWACLHPKALRHGSGGVSSKGRSSRRKGADERVPLLDTQAAEDTASSSSYTASSAATFVEGVIERVLERQNDAFISDLGNNDVSSPSSKSMTGTFHQTYAKRYLRHRVADSEWEMARFCYGEIVGMDIDVDGDEVLVLDNPSPALLEIVSELASGDGSGKPGMGLVALETQEESGCCGKRTVNRTAFARPSLDFIFQGAGASVKMSQEFQREFRKKLEQSITDMTADLSGLVFHERQKEGDLIVKLTGPSKAIEALRASSVSSVQVFSYYGRMVGGHPTVIVKRDLMMPYFGVRGKSGALNFVVDLLQFRDGYLGTGPDSDPPGRMLFGIFDARHQPHPDFWRQCLPKFVKNSDVGYNYEVNDQVALVQAPQAFAAVSLDEDILDVSNGMCFNIMNVIRNRCGGVTSCGTNAVWQIDAREFSRQEDESVTKEYFDSRTKIEDTASTHILFCKGKRSVYVQEKVCTGIAKVNSEYLCALLRWAEGAVQLFWLQIFADKTKQLVGFGLCVLTFLGALFASLYGPWAKALLGLNFFCDVEGSPTLLLGYSHSFCQDLYGLFSSFLGHTNDKVMFQLAAEDYMRLVDFAITWFCICLAIAAFTIFLAWRGAMPKIVRVFIMMENISYWLTSCSIFFWTSLTLFMIVGAEPPLMFNVTHFMLFILAINITQHSMLNEYKYMGECDEISIWRSQQSYTLAAPMYIMAIVRGTAAAWGIIWKRLDKSFWTSNEYGSDIVMSVTLWVTFIWAAFVSCVCYTLAMMARQWLLNEIGNKIHTQCQMGAICMLGLLAITVWEPFLNLWGVDKTINRLSKGGKEVSGVLSVVSGYAVWWRSHVWIMRYAIDFGMPLIVLSGMLGGGVNLITLATYASTVHGFRG